MRGCVHAGLASALAAVLLVVPALARADLQPSGHSPTRGVDRAAAHTAPVPGALLYHDGAFMQSATVYVVYWDPTGSAFRTGFKSLVEGYLANVAADAGTTSNVFGVGAQYGTGYGITYGGAFVDRDALPPGECSSEATASAPRCLSEPQVMDELYAFLNAHGLSGDSGVWPLHPTRVFAFYLPPHVADCFVQDGSELCSANAAHPYYCAYHSGFNDGTASFAFANLPYVWGSAGCQQGQSPNGDAEADAAISVTSHELTETLTDPFSFFDGSAWVGGWWDANGYEIADKCDANYGTALGSALGQSYNQLIGGGRYWTQLEYSNALQGCYQVGPPAVSSFQNGPAGTTVQIGGANFFGPVTVAFNGVFSSSVTVDSPTSLHVQVPAGNAAGTITVHALGGAGSSTQSFDPRPHVSSLGAVTAYAGATVTVSGSGFFGVQTVRFNGIAASFGNVASDGTSLQAVVPPAATDGPVTVATAGGTSTDPAQFAVLPKVTGLTPRNSKGGQTVTLTGSGLAGATGVAFVGAAHSATIAHDDANTIVVTVPSDALTGAVTVTTPNGSAASPALKLLPHPTRTAGAGAWPR